MDLSTESIAARAAVVLMVLMLVAAGCGSAASGSGSAATTGATGGESTMVGAEGGLGDEYFPQAGNPGYDVLHYDITLDCDPWVGSLSGMTVVEAKSSAALAEFDLDFKGLEVKGVRVDGVAAEYRRVGQELIVDPATDLAAGSTFSVEVTYSGTPEAMRSAAGYPEGWQHSGDTIFTLDEPEGAATWFPLNDHPSDKATYTFRLTVPTQYIAVANGNLVDALEGEGRHTFVWEMDKPMASYLAAVAVGDFISVGSTSYGGVPISSYFDHEVLAAARTAFADTGRALDYFASLFGPYPFATYGVVVPDASTGGAAMENQTMSLFGRDVLEKSMDREFSREMVLSHELAHQWFGDSVTLKEWKDVWLNEGFATYASWLWIERQLGKRGMEQCLQSAYATASKGTILLGDPGVAGLFSRVVYERGALTLHALRTTVGDDLFFGILRDWVSQHAYGSVTTEDFIALVKEKTGSVAGFDAQAFFDAWLYQEELPGWSTAATATQ